MKKMSKTVLATTLGTTLMLTSIMPAVKAEEVTPDISSWALGTLNEGEKYGIFPIEWYYDGFRTAITTERLDSLIELTAQKIASLNLDKNEEFKPVPIKGGGTRGDVINRLYNIVGQYKLDTVEDAVTYMQKHKILQGSEKGLMLDQKATTQHAVIFAVRLIQDTFEQANAGAKGVAWIVEDEDTKVYMLGSIHVGTPDMYPMHKKLTKAFDESDGLFVEANLLDPTGMDYYIEKAMFNDGRTIKDVVSEETYAKLQKVAAQLEMPIEELEIQKPWLLSNNFSSMMMDGAFGLTAEEMAMHGVDMQFLLTAYLQQKPIYELEGINAQVDMFEALSPEAQEESLVAALDGILEPTEQSEEDVQLMADWFTNWVKGDVEKFAESLTEMEGDTSEFNQMLFGKRDAEMAAKLVDVLEKQKGTFFVVVGAGHFLVDKNIRYHLEQSGYEVKPFYQ
ncbi:TraB/GumN family protein [Solibacillus isronensis]|uniref:TraB/GumN family protein n=1 Tax=Solibacillus isronensis TaxID=412383 RepID=UPI00203BC7BC|nr:TraB/GumN family protein [Solibacillus isronensis]MCM3721312.1 TraB/GumN family protein [Solibacillus isronensis]